MRLTALTLAAALAASGASAQDAGQWTGFYAGFATNIISPEFDNSATMQEILDCERLSRLYAPPVLWQMVYGDTLSLEQMQDEATVSAFCVQLRRLLSMPRPISRKYSLSSDKIAQH